MRSNLGWRGGARLWIAASLSVWGGLVGCEEYQTLPRATPEVEVLGWCTKAERSYIELTLAERDRQDVDVLLQLQSPTSGWLATGPTGSGLRGLATGVPGQPIHHLIEWGQSCAGAPRCELDCGDPPEGACVARPEDLPETLQVRVRMVKGDKSYEAPTEAGATFDVPALGDCEPAP